MKRALQIIFAVVILISVLLSLDAYLHKQWETLTATLSLIIAIISAWIAYEAFYKQNESEQPQLILSFDLRGRFSIVQLVITNYGNKPAFNITIEWETPLKDTLGKDISFTTNNKPIPVLNKDERLNILLDESTRLFQAFKDYELTYGGYISYTSSINSRSVKKTPFYISLDSYKLTLLHDHESERAFYELAKLPECFSKIQNELKQLREAISPK